MRQGLVFRRQQNKMRVMWQKKKICSRVTSAHTASLSCHSFAKTSKKASAASSNEQCRVCVVWPDPRPPMARKNSRREQKKRNSLCKKLLQKYPEMLNFTSFWSVRFTWKWLCLLSNLNTGGLMPTSCYRDASRRSAQCEQVVEAGARWSNAPRHAYKRTRSQKYVR